MAEAGFYLVGNANEPDLVRCYYCRRELDGWEPTDVPWDEHKRRNCPYISLGKTPQELTVEDAFNLEAERKCILLVSLNFIPMILWKNFKSNENEYFSERGWQESRGTVSSLCSRTKSKNRRSWCSHSAKKRKEKEAQLNPNPIQLKHFCI